MADTKQIQHLYWRAGFGMSPKEWATRRHWSRDKAIDELFRQSGKVAPLDSRDKGPDMTLAEFKKLSKTEQKRLQKQTKELMVTQNAKWVSRMADPKESPLLEKMCLFWHGHFACVSKNAKMAYHQLKTIRQYALGNFRDFVQSMAKDPSMIRFLNNQQNRKQQPNENFARELMELFTLGRGQYTEKDIKEAARAFTGWSSNIQGDFIFRKRQHDYGQKQFMGQRGNFDGDDIINIILDKKETALFISRKIYRFFVNEQVNEKRVKELGDYFYAQNYNIGKTMRYLFSSDWFYDPANMGNRIKSPVELFAGMMRQLKVEVKEDRSILFVEKALGQILFIPPNVAGWEGGKSWIDNSTLMIRLNLANLVFQETEVDFKVKEELTALKRSKSARKLKATIDLKPMLQVFGRTSEATLFEEIQSYLLSTPPQWTADFMRDFTVNRSKATQIKSLTVRLMTLPEYQLC
ncbi:MAG: DUF1800 domain-containing protein [Bacteroidota bacterium]